MKNTKALLVKYVIVFIVITGLQCAAAVLPIFVPLIGAKDWVDNAAKPKDHHFNFVTVDTPDSNYSNFDGNEHFVDGGSQHFTGFYKNHDLTFIYDNEGNPERDGKTYKGTVNEASTIMTLKGSDATNPLPAITLNKQP